MNLVRCHVARSALTRSRIEFNVGSIQIRVNCIMKKHLVAGIAAAAICGALVLAADMPKKAPVSKAADPGYHRAGFYAGVDVGVGLGHDLGRWSVAPNDLVFATSHLTPMDR
jgi:hypothetical protein